SSWSMAPPSPVNVQPDRATPVAARIRRSTRESSAGISSSARANAWTASRVARLIEVHRDHRGQLTATLGIHRDERFGGELVERTSILLEQRAVRRVLHQRVTEEVLELGLDRRDLDEAARLERAQVGAGVHAVFASRSRSRIRTPNWRPMTDATRSV